MRIQFDTGLFSAYKIELSQIQYNFQMTQPRKEATIFLACWNLKSIKNIYWTFFVLIFVLYDFYSQIYLNRLSESNG